MGHVDYMASIIVPCYNSERFIGDCISSIKSQTYQNWECIIIDDGSDDSTLSLVQSLVKDDSRFKLIHLESNHGAAIARNKGISASRGRYIAFLDSDDIWLDKKLETQISFMQNNAIGFSFSSYYVADASLAVSHIRRAPFAVSYSDILKKNHIGCLTAAFDTDKYGKVLMPEVKKRQDLGLWLKILKDINQRAYGIEEPLAVYRKRPDSLSANKIHAVYHTWHLYSNIEKLPLPSVVYYLSHYLTKGVLSIALAKISRLITRENK